MASNDLIAMKKTAKKPKEGDVFVLQPSKGIFYFGKVIETEVKRVVNHQPWRKGYFETIGNIKVSQNEKNVEFAFWNVLKDKYVDISGKEIENKPLICGIYGLASYGAIGKEVQKAIKCSEVIWFINGFLYNNIITNRADDIDFEFKNRFHNWVKEKLERSQDVKFHVERNYVFYLNQVFQDSSQKINIFFQFCEDFFCEMDKE